jgi:hypothetical protein
MTLDITTEQDRISDTLEAAAIKQGPRLRSAQTQTQAGMTHAVAQMRVTRDLQSAEAALDEALRIKPERHRFRMDQRGADPALPRHMSMTGG